ncbi:hypothetical protein F2P81_026187 [Scophthalmus maximus]|nr:hypothetical protein F2P81_026187 [Scophthalmus maximus]
MNNAKVSVHLCRIIRSSFPPSCSQTPDEPLDLCWGCFLRLPSDDSADSRIQEPGVDQCKGSEVSRTSHPTPRKTDVFHAHGESKDKDVCEDLICNRYRNEPTPSNHQRGETCPMKPNETFGATENQNSILLGHKQMWSLAGNVITSRTL